MQKLYQAYDEVESAIITEVNGVALTKNLFFNGSQTIWDISDLVPSEVIQQKKNNFNILETYSWLYQNQ